jgi:hypothetical protein
MPAKKFKVSYQFTQKSSGVEITPELFTKLNTAYQILANIGADLGIEVMVAEYNGNYYLDRKSLEEIQDLLF